LSKNIDKFFHFV